MFDVRQRTGRIYPDPEKRLEFFQLACATAVEYGMSIIRQPMSPRHTDDLYHGARSYVRRLEKETSRPTGQAVAVSPRVVRVLGYFSSWYEQAAHDLDLPQLSSQYCFDVFSASPQHPQSIHVGTHPDGFLLYHVLSDSRIVQGHNEQGFAFSEVVGPYDTLVFGGGLDQQVHGTWNITDMPQVYNCQSISIAQGQIA